MDQPRRRYDRIFAPEYLTGLDQVGIDELRKRRSECEEVEAELSFTRRLLQGKLDILTHELERREAGGDTGIESLKAKLSEIFTERTEGTDGISGQVKHNRILVPASSESSRREVEKLASETVLSHIEEISNEELEVIIDRLTEAEKDASLNRRKIQMVIDELGGEMVRRYKEGTQDPSALLTN
jgi:hypothetical protein